MKAILVVDIPDDYEEYGNGDWYVMGDDLKIVYDDYGALMEYKYIDYDMAQLKPMPQKKTTDSRKMATTEAVWYNGGYNTCIDEILGDTE